MTSATIAASVSVLRWAAQRAHLHDDDLAKRFPKWSLWLSEEAQPTLRQLEDFARITHTSFGYFFLLTPPKTTLPVPDFRTMRDEVVTTPSSELLDTIYLCQQRQDWYREYARLQHSVSLPFISSAKPGQAPEPVADAIRTALTLSAHERRAIPNWEAALQQLIGQAEEAGILVMASSVVGGNSHRHLDVGEFRGFVLADALAPLIFLNGSDSKSAQMFTLAHELAHLWLGNSGVSDTQVGRIPTQHTERWCNLVAAELLMPMKDLRSEYQANTVISDELQHLARIFKVSTLVALRRLFDAGYIDQATLWQQYRQEETRLCKLKERRSNATGGNPYRTIPARASKRFTRAIVSSALEGMTSFSEANRLLGVRKTATFDKLAREIGVAV